MLGMKDLPAAPGAPVLTRPGHDGGGVDVLGRVGHALLALLDVAGDEGRPALPEPVALEAVPLPVAPVAVDFTVGAVASDPRVEEPGADFALEAALVPGPVFGPHLVGVVDVPAAPGAPLTAGGLDHVRAVVFAVAVGPEKKNNT